MAVSGCVVITSLSTAGETWKPKTFESLQKNLIGQNKLFFWDYIFNC